MTEPTTPDKLDEILKKAWEHGYYSNNYPSDPNMTWFSDDKQELTNLIQTLEKKAVTKELERLEGFLGIPDVGLCEADLNKLLIWVKNAKWAVIAPKGKNTTALNQQLPRRRKQNNGLKKLHRYDC